MDGKHAGGICSSCGTEYGNATKDNWGNIHFNKCYNCLGEEYKPRKRGIFIRIFYWPLGFIDA